MEETDWKQGGLTYRYPKKIQPREGDFVEMPAVIKLSSDISFEEYCKEVLRFIKELESSGKLTDYNQLAFLFRSVKNKRVLALANFLEENGISVFSPRSALFFEREEIQLLMGAIIFIFPNLFEDLNQRSSCSSVPRIRGAAQNRGLCWHRWHRVSSHSFCPHPRYPPPSTI